MKPTPGSPLAILDGCSCEPYQMAEDCPLHADEYRERAAAFVEDGGELMREIDQIGEAK